MSQIIIPVSISKAIEMMNCLLFGTLESWLENRAHHSLHYWTYKNGDYELIKKRVDDFTKSIKDLRITKVTSESQSAYEAGHNPNEDCDEIAKVISFQLGDNKNLDQVVVEVILEEDLYAHFEEPVLWGSWSLPPSTVIRCTEHYDDKFKNYIVLGG